MLVVKGIKLAEPPAPLCQHQEEGLCNRRESRAKGPNRPKNQLSNASPRSTRDARTVKLALAKLDYKWMRQRTKPKKSNGYGDVKTTRHRS